MSNLPRNGTYELFTNDGKTYCLDDPSFQPIPTPAGMFDWVRAQDCKYWAPMTHYPENNTALYLQPELYTLWKLRWA